MNQSRSRRTAVVAVGRRGLVGLGMVALAASLAGCGGVLDPVGPVGAAIRTIVLNSLVIMLAIVVPTIIATLAFAWWFRAGNPRAVYRPTWSYSGRVELVVWSIPTIVILFLGGIIWIGSHQLDPARALGAARPLQVQVVALDWKWLFIYPEQQVAAVNELVVPVGRPLSFTLTSASVMNTFFVPRLGSMIYTMNGMATRLNLQADVAGTYVGFSGHFSGDGYSDMLFRTVAVPPEAFAAWAERTAATSPPLDRGAYLKLAEQSSNLPPSTWRLADPRLFAAILTQEVPPSRGPKIGHPSPDVSHRPGG